MQLTTYDNLRISGVEYRHILELQIHQKICEHASAFIKLEVKPDKAQNFLEHITEADVIQIYANEQVIYAGLVTDTDISYFENDAHLSISLISTSKALDCIFESHSYQNVGVLFSNIMQKAVGGNGNIETHFDDKETEGIIIQYQETDWAFVRRLAILCESFVVPDMTSKRPKIIVGNNPNSSDLIEFVGTVKAGSCIIEVFTEMRKGVLVTETRKEKNGKIQGVIPAVYKGSPVAGKIFSGVVEKIEGDKLQAHITDIDAEYEEGNWWFPYSTIYSSPTNLAGVYTMPKEKESVRLFFPSENSADAFAASSLNGRENGADSKEKVFTSPAGMGVKFYNDGLMVYCAGKTVYIDLKKNGEILLSSNKQISLIAKNGMSLNPSGKLKVISEKEIYLGTRQSFIDLNAKDGGTVDIYSQKIFVK